MSSYITNKRPTLKQKLLNYLGFVDLPVRVNCWYCCQDSFILPGSKNTVDHWYCNLCESTNTRDENGDIADPTPFEALNGETIPAIERSASTIHTNSANTLCNDCQANQQIIYQYLADYIPDESDPTYEIKFNNVDEYKHQLHQRFKLCRRCQNKIERLNKEQRAFMEQQRCTASFVESSHSILPTVPSKHAFYLKGFLWTILHLWTIVFGCFCIVCPPQSINLSWPTQLFRKGTFYSLQTVMVLLDYASDIRHSFIVPLRYILSFTSNEPFYWELDNNEAFILLGATYISFIVRKWHCLTRANTAKLVKYKAYKNAQVMLVLLRLVFFAALVFNASKNALILVLSFYIILLLVSYFMVKQSVWPYDRIGKINESFISEEYEDNFAGEPMEITPDEPLSILSPSTQQHQQHHVPDGVEVIANRLHKIAF